MPHIVREFQGVWRVVTLSDSLNEFRPCITKKIHFQNVFAIVLYFILHQGGSTETACR